MDQQNKSLKPVNAPKFAFFYMLSLVSLIFVSISSGVIIFQIINKYIKDIAGNYDSYYSDDALKFGISAILIATPIFYIITTKIYKSLFTGELDKEAGVRRWLTYFILFVSSVVMIGWAIAIINNFLNGELTIKFILKALTALLISAVSFSFYLYDIKRAEVLGKKDKVIKIYFIASLAIIIIVFIASLFIVESPYVTRNKRIDDKIISNFFSIDGCINEYYNKNKKLPENIAQTEKMCTYSIGDITKDEETGKEFEYKITGEKTYELCADFRTSNKGKNGRSCPDCYYSSPEAKNSIHDVGWQCLGREVYNNELEVKRIIQ